MKIEEYFVVSSIDEDGDREYISVDSHSGGYLYWGRLYGCKRYKQEELSVEKIYQEIKGSYLDREPREIFISKIVVSIEQETQLDDIPNMIIAEKRKKLEETIAAAQAELKGLEK